MMLDEKKLAWLYMLTYGQCGVQLGTHGQYEATFETFTSQSWFNAQRPGDLTKLKEKMFGEIGLKIVDWSKTETIEDSSVVCDDVITVTKGTLVLKDGTEQKWIADYVKAEKVFPLMASVLKGSGGQNSDVARVLWLLR